MYVNLVCLHTPKKRTDHPPSFSCVYEYNIRRTYLLIYMPQAPSRQELRMQIGGNPLLLLVLSLGPIH